MTLMAKDNLSPFALTKDEKKMLERDYKKPKVIVDSHFLINYLMKHL